MEVMKRLWAEMIMQAWLNASSVDKQDFILPFFVGQRLLWAVLTRLCQPGYCFMIFNACFTMVANRALPANGGKELHFDDEKTSASESTVWNQTNRVRARSFWCENLHCQHFLIFKLFVRMLFSAILLNTISLSCMPWPFPSHAYRTHSVHAKDMQTDLGVTHMSRSHASLIPGLFSPRCVIFVPSSSLRQRSVQLDFLYKSWGP